MPLLKLTVELEVPSEIDDEDLGQAEPEITRALVGLLWNEAPDSLPIANFAWDRPNS